MSGASVSIDRTTLSLPALVITDDGSTTTSSGAVLRFTDEGIGYVVQSPRVKTMPDSDDVDGSEPISFAREATGLPLTFYIIGSSSAAVEAAKDEVETALFRLSYAVTRSVDGVSKTYSGGPCLLTPVRASVDHGVVAAHFDTYSVTIPFYNPNPVS